MKFGFHSFPFSTVFRTLFLLGRVPFLVALTGLRLTNNLPMLSQSLTSMRGGKMRPKASFKSNCEEQPMLDSKVDHW